MEQHKVSIAIMITITNDDNVMRVVQILWWFYFNVKPHDIWEGDVTTRGET